MHNFIFTQSDHLLKAGKLNSHGYLSDFIRGTKGAVLTG